ncbi:MAG: hypothetical protein ABIR35_02100 [Polaromonas sp.]
MNQQSIPRATALIFFVALGALTACAGRQGANELPRYQCEHGIEFTVRFADDTAVLDGTRGKEILYRDAGGQGAQTVYSNPRLRAEFGLGASGRDAVLHDLLAPLQARCVRG